ncbi:MAG: hypothetical protein FWF76_04845 [Oscillospiraceae bacterium]|nr:hypothetical protein [Oscillospiraceae bacterium]
MKKLKLFALIAMGITVIGLSGCEFSTTGFGGFWNGVIIAFGILAGVVLLAFIVFAIVSAFYKGKIYEIKVIKKKEDKVLRGNTIGRGTPGYKGQTDLSRRARRQKGRIRYCKVVAEIEGENKTLKCNDLVILDKLIIGKTNKVRIRFGEIIKIIKK